MQGPVVLTGHVREIVEQAQGYLDELRAAATAAHERLRTSLLRLAQQSKSAAPESPVAESDAIFATRAIDVSAKGAEAPPNPPTRGLVRFDIEEKN